MIPNVQDLKDRCRALASALYGRSDNTGAKVVTSRTQGEPRARGDLWEARSFAEGRRNDHRGYGVDELAALRDLQRTLEAKLAALLEEKLTALRGDLRARAARYIEDSAALVRQAAEVEAILGWKPETAPDPIRALIEGSPTPPTEAEAEAAEKAGHLWRCVATIDGEPSPGLSFDCAKYVRAGTVFAGLPRRKGSVYVERWWLLDKHGIVIARAPGTST